MQLASVRPSDSTKAVSIMQNYCFNITAMKLIRPLASVVEVDKETEIALDWSNKQPLGTTYDPWIRLESGNTEDSFFIQ